MTVTISSKSPYNTGCITVNVPSIIQVVKDKEQTITVLIIDFAAPLKHKYEIMCLLPPEFQD